MGSVPGFREHAHDRRVLIKKIIDERGFKSILELKRILFEEYGLDVKSRETLYNDMKHMGGIQEKDFKNLSQRLVAGFQYHLNTLNRLAESSKDDKTRIMAINAYFKGTKDLAELINKLYIRDKVAPVMDGKPQKKDEKFNIRFSDKVEEVDDGEKD